MECQSGVRSGAAPAGISAADISAYLPESVGQGSLVTEHLREVSPLSRWGNVVRGRTHPRSDRLPSGIGLLPHPSSAVSSAFFAVRFPLRGDNGVSLFTFSITPGVGSCLSAGGAPSATGEFGASVPDHLPFWFKPDSILGLSLVTAFISTSPGLTCPGLLAPDRRDAGSRRVGSHVHGRSEDRGYVVPHASDVTVAGDARWGSRPMAEHRVMSENLLGVTHYRSRRCYESQPNCQKSKGPDLDEWLSISVC